VVLYRGVAWKRECDKVDSSSDGVLKPSRAGGYHTSSSMVNNFKRWCEGKEWCK